MLSQLYTDLKNKLAELTWIQYIDLYNSQYYEANFRKEGASIPFPAVLIEIQPIQWTTATGGSQNGIVVIAFHIVQEQYSDSYFNRHGGSDNVADALLKLDRVDEVHTHLQGNSGAIHSPLDRTETQIDSDHDNVIVYINSYNSTLVDDTTNREASMIDVTPWSADVSEEVLDQLPTNAVVTDGFRV